MSREPNVKVSNKDGVILYFFSRIFPDVTGGAEVFAYRLSKELSKKGHRVTIISLSGSSEISSFYSKIRTSVGTRYPGFFRSGPLHSEILLRIPVATLFALVCGLTSKAKVMLCFSTSSLIFGYPISRFFRKRCGVRFIGEDIFILDFKPPSLRKRIYKVIFQIGFHTAKHADYIVVMSSWMKDYLVGKGLPREKFIVIPNGVDLITDDLVETKKESSVKLIYVGRFDRAYGTKQVPMLIEVFARFVKRYPDASLTLVGDGPDRRVISKMVSELGLEESSEPNWFAKTRRS